MDHIGNLPRAFIDRIRTSHTLCPAVSAVEDLTSADGTRKWLLRLEDGNTLETVFIPEDERGTLCVSSQIGCSLSCSFCHTGTQRLARNVTASEIVEQVWWAKRALGDIPGGSSTRKPIVSNVVFMGQGEPLYNYRNVRKAVQILTHAEGLAMPRRRVTVSTSGVAPLIPRLASELGVQLAISLHAPNDETRSRIMGINRQFPLRALLASCRDYAAAMRAAGAPSRALRITFEYVMLRGVNDQPGHAKQLATLLAQLPALVNLIPFNPWPGSQFQCSSLETIDTFARALSSAGLQVTVRTPRGRDILAACGQLRSSREEQEDVAACGQLRPSQGGAVA